MDLILYLIALVIVILFLVGVAILSVRLHTKEEIHQYAEKKAHLVATNDLAGIDNQPRRSSFRALKGERTIV